MECETSCKNAELLEANAELLTFFLLVGRWEVLEREVLRGRTTAAGLSCHPAIHCVMFLRRLEGSRSALTDYDSIRRVGSGSRSVEVRDATVGESLDLTGRTKRKKITHS